MSDKTYENRLRRRARRLGMSIHETRSPYLDGGRYALIDDQVGSVVLGGGPLGLCTLDEIETHITLLVAQLKSEVTSWAP